MRTEDFDYCLPPELIAQDPIEPRDASRLLVLDKASGQTSHKMFADLPFYLKPGDCLVINETKVMPARLLGTREGTGGKVEILLVTPLADGGWEAMVKPGKRLVNGSRITFDPPVLTATVAERLDGGMRRVMFECEGDFRKCLDRIGLVPLPPYITHKLKDKNRYQTVYAAKDGSVAAPTAGLHFTPELMKKIRVAGISVTAVDLTVGPGTFQPIKAEKVEDHIMHSERFEMPEGAADAVNNTRQSGGRVIAVGTTSARVLETMTGNDGITRAGAGNTDIFIYPGYRFKAIDGLLTNFHLPKSTLLMLVCAMAGRDNIIKGYEEAVQQRYRFFSFGDAMLIL